MKIRSLLRGLRVTELADPAAEAIRGELGDDGNNNGASRVYRLESSGFDGWIIASLMAARQDELEFDEPSGLEILRGRVVDPRDESLAVD